MVQRVSASFGLTRTPWVLLGAICRGLGVVAEAREQGVAFKRVLDRLEATGVSRVRAGDCGCEGFASMPEPRHHWVCVSHTCRFLQSMCPTLAT